jgi:hypothetical protein
MTASPLRTIALLLALAAASACSTASQPFLDRAHRQNYDLQDAELEKVQFYVSENILAQELGPSGTLEGPDHVFVIEAGTRGVATAAGPHWLRVSFGPEEGALFLADPDARPDSAYFLASDGEAGQPPRRVRDQSDKIVRVGERRFRVVYGASARLLIDNGDLSRLIEARPHLGGRKAD